MSEKLGFLLKLPDMNKNEILSSGLKLIRICKSELVDSLCDELIQCNHLRPINSENFIEADKYSVISENGFSDTFPTTKIALRSYLPLIGSIHSSKRLFSKLR